jgi:hypothetical protein
VLTLLTLTKSYDRVVPLSSHLRKGEKFQSSEARGINGMAISANSFVIALLGTGWKSVGGQLLASGVLLLSGYQDIGLRSRMGAASAFLWPWPSASPL